MKYHVCLLETTMKSKQSNCISDQKKKFINSIPFFQNSIESIFKPNCVNYKKNYSHNLIKYKFKPKIIRFEKKKIK